MTALGRGALLRIIQSAPVSLYRDLAEQLGFEYKDRQSSTEIAFIPAASANNKDDIQIAKSKPSASIWHQSSYQARKPVAITAKKAPLRRKIRKDEPQSASLLTSAQQQNIWDACLRQQQHAKQMDVRKVVRMLAQGQPIVELPKRKLATDVQETVLLLDRSDHLTPIWEDQMDMAASLKKRLGAAHCQVVLLLDGALGSTRRLLRGRPRDWNWDQLPEAARLVFVSDLARYSAQSTDTKAWRWRLEGLHILGHKISVLNPVAEIAGLRYASGQSLDPRPSRFAHLQSAVVGCLQPKLSRIRQIRRQIARGSLEDELKLWNHPQGQQIGLKWRLKTSLLRRWVSISTMNDQQWHQLNDLQQWWRDSMPIETEGIERLMDEFLNLTDQQADPALVEDLLVRYQRNPGENTGASRWLQSQAQMLSGEAGYLLTDPKWGLLLQSVESILTGSAKDQVSSLRDNKKLYVRQIGADLVFSGAADRALTSVNTPALDTKNGKLITTETRINGQQLTLWTVDSRRAYTVLHQPSWAEWKCVHHPWSWAVASGVDDYGLWAELKVKKVRYRLRWIPPGEFMMGSPYSEEYLEDDEIQHRVKLTRGFWLGETSVTQALWEAVMGSNPSHHSGYPGLPVENVSWDDCQSFLGRLKSTETGIPASLPTEAQWEHACRAGTQTAYWFGDDLDEKYANNGGGTKVETNYKPNPFGLRSMHGNVWEWCADWHGDYPDTQVDDPAGPDHGHSRVLRGGC